MVEISFDVVSLSHKLNARSLEWLNRDSTQIHTTLIDERHFTLRSKIADLHTSEFREATYKSYRYLWTWLLSLNVGGVAHFDFAQKDLGGRILKAFPKSVGATPTFVAMTAAGKFDEFDVAFDEEDSRRAGLVFIAAAKESESWILDEYIKGLYHFGGSIYGIEFWKDAFANFYRLFEYFVTRRLLVQKKLANEVKEIEKALTQCGVPMAIIEMFSQEVYRLRSSQVMHAQAEQHEIGPEEAGKAKILCDLAMLSAYRPIWQKTLGPPPA